MQKEFSLWWSVWFCCIWVGSLMWRWAASSSYWGPPWLARSAKYRLSSRIPCLSPSPTSSSGWRAPGCRDPRSSMWGESGLSPAAALFCLPDCPGSHTASCLGRDSSQPGPNPAAWSQPAMPPDSVQGQQHLRRPAMCLVPGWSFPAVSLGSQNLTWESLAAHH